jgi:hypothetical protein
MTLVEQPACRPTPSLLDSSVRLGYERRMEAKSRVEEGPGPSTARELQAVLHAAREGAPFLVYRDPAGAQRIVRFGSERSELTLGRNPTADLSIGWDDQVSALHAVIDRLAGELTLRDDGLSRNGSYLNGERVHGIRRLRDGDSARENRPIRHRSARGRLTADPEEATGRKENPFCDPRRTEKSSFHFGLFPVARVRNGTMSGRLQPHGSLRPHPATLALQFVAK